MPCRYRTLQGICETIVRITSRFSANITGLMTRVLVLDGRQRAALAVTRSLGIHGVEVYVAAERIPCIAGASRFASRQLRYPDPAASAQEFLTWVEQTAGALGIEVVFPITDMTTMVLATASNRVGGPRFACPPEEAYELVSDKGRLVELAGRAGVPVPHTSIARSAAEIRSHLEHAAFPLVLKPARSRGLIGDRIVSTSVCVAGSRAKAEAYLDEQDWLDHIPCLIQQYVDGYGAGVFALFAQGRAVAWFAHRRIREKPPQGGVSVLSESVPVDPQLKEMAQRLLVAAQWHGPAMVEFKIGRDGTPYLMEINGRLWGSLQLPIDSGVDFPWLLLRLTRGETLEAAPDYPAGHRLRWFCGDLDNLLLELRGKGLAHGASQKATAFLRFLASCGDLKARNEVVRWHDMRPALHELYNWLRRTN
jgi:predicted ATP-grasp superfamily ATP-dependent carboligase